jgi:hypothetical protein
LYNAVYNFRRSNNPGDSDASLMFQTLLNWKESDPLWIVRHRLDSVSRKLNSLLWMSPSQRSLYEDFHDVIFMDTTSNTNRFQMMLCVIAVIDNHFKTRIIACSLIEDETMESFQWIYDTLLEETGIVPITVFTDNDPAMIGALKTTYPITKHMICIFHIDLNLKKKLKGKLGSRFETFRSEFYHCRNSLCEALFESRWSKLLDNYPTVTKYLNDTLYNTKESWASPWINKYFTGGAQSTQRIESINSHIHQKVDRSTSLYDLLNSLNDIIKQGEHLMKFEIQRNAIPTIGLPMLNHRFFYNVDKILEKFLTPNMLNKQRDQMNMSVCYDVTYVDEWQDLIEVSYCLYIPCIYGYNTNINFCSLI